VRLIVPASKVGC